jgi:hypothetical protein
MLYVVEPFAATLGIMMIFVGLASDNEASVNLPGFNFVFALGHSDSPVTEA